MGLLVKENIDQDCLLGIWEIVEDYNELYSKVKLTQKEELTLESFLNIKRKVEWLSVRALVKSLLNRNVTIQYNEVNKPFLHDGSLSISISHSQNLTAILLSKTKRVGIDLEYMSHRIEKISNKFINDHEFITNDVGMRNYHLYIHWCAKEALYKICDKQDINFKTNLTLKPFDAKAAGLIKGIVNNKFGIDDYDLHYYRYDNYVIAWCTK